MKISASMGVLLRNTRPPRPILRLRAAAFLYT
jgi:hypothetical protein